MTREEAIQVLNMVEAHGLADEAKRMAIEALQADAVMRDATAEERASVQRYIDSISTEAVSVVRCKDCRYYECGGLPCPLDVCESLGDDGFCSRGERREPLPQYEEWQDEFNKMCESARPTTFVADEWYRDTFKGEEK